MQGRGRTRAPRPALLAGLAALGLLGAACAHDAGAPQTLVLPEPSPQGPRALVVISVAGLSPAAYRGPSPVMPTVAALAEAGASADAMRGVAPASSYPAHATLGSGRRPSGHGIVAERRVGERGVGSDRYSDVADLTAPTLWGQAAQAGLRVATLGWPTTVGAKVSSNLPDVEPDRPGESWLAALRRSAAPDITALAEQQGAGAAEAAAPGSARDSVLVNVACQLAAGGRSPQLLFLHLSQTAAPLRRQGADSPAARAAFASADQELARMLACVQAEGRLAYTSFIIVGDHGVMAVHTVVAPNALLASAGLLTPVRNGKGVVSWSALARSNGGTAFLYAREREDALLARRALEEGAAATGAFRVVSAQEMLRVGADPAAWFGLEAEPGFVFSDDSKGPTLRAAASRGGAGYLPGHPEMDAGFVAWGPGIARGVRIPVMHQTDVAPTLAPLMGVALEGAEGRVLVGVLRLPRVAAPLEPRGAP